MPNKCYFKKDEERIAFVLYQRASQDSKISNHQHEVFIIQKNSDIDSIKIEVIINRDMARAANQRCLYRHHLESNRVVENRLYTNRNMFDPVQFFKRWDRNFLSDFGNSPVWDRN